MVYVVERSVNTEPPPPARSPFLSSSIDRSRPIAPYRKFFLPSKSFRRYIVTRSWELRGFRYEDYPRFPPHEKAPPMKSLAVRTLAALSLLGAIFAACSSDKDGQSSAGVSKRGESCQSSGDCESGFICVQGTCTVGSYNLQPTGKQCFLVACHAPEDCCPTPPSICPSLQTECEAGFTSECAQYQQQCVCDASKFSCDEGKCSQSCTPGDNVSTFDSCRFFGSNLTCVGGKCVECTTDSQCFDSFDGKPQVCKDNKCQSKCAKDTDCDPFYRCDTASQACVYAGCKTNLECVSKTGNPLAVCDNTKCGVPCKSDPECRATSFGGTPDGVMPGLQVCVDAHCVDVGCDSDDQCRILNRIEGGSNITAECRAPAAP